jgi:transposase
VFTLPSAVQVFICLQPTDMRKSFDSLSALVSQVVNQNPLSGHLFVFLNRPRNRIKILFWDRSGYGLYYKRLEAGTFVIPPRDDAVPAAAAAISVPELMLILEGIDLTHSRQRKRFSLKKS